MMDLDPLVNWKLIDPAEKVRIVEAMGFYRIGDDHSPDCRFYDDDRCVCVPDALTFAIPEDVAIFLGETWEDRLARKNAKKFR